MSSFSPSLHTCMPPEKKHLYLVHRNMGKAAVIGVLFVCTVIVVIVLCALDIIPVKKWFKAPAPAAVASTTIIPAAPVDCVLSDWPLGGRAEPTERGRGCEQ